MFGAERLLVAEKDEFDKSINRPQPASETIGCNLINSVVTFRAMAGEVKLVVMLAKVKVIFK